MTVGLDKADLRDIAKLMRIAQKECQFRFYELAQSGMRGTNNGKDVENALRGAITYAEKFEKLYKQATERENDK